MGAIGVLVVLLFIIYLMVRSLGFNSKTPPKMVLRKLQVVFRSFYAPLFYPRKLAAANELHDAGKLTEALDLYLELFDFDGLTSSRAEIAIHNDTVLEYIEEICEQTGYDFPSERINRFREDLYDYFLVKTKYLAATDYDQTPLHRPENEDRFKDELNLTQESQLIEGFEHFLTTLCNKIEQHIKGGAQILPRGTKTSKPKEASTFGEDQVPAGATEAAVVAAPSDPFAANAAAGPFGEGPAGGGDLPAPPDPFGGSSDPFGGGQAAEIAPPPDPFASSASSGGDVAPPAGLFGDGQGAGDVDPFSFNDPLDPYHDATGVMHKLPGAAEDPPQAGFDANAHADVGGDSTRVSSMPDPPAPPAPPAPLGSGMPQPTGGFPGFGAPNTGIPAPPAPGGFPQPTGAFPGMGQAPPAPQPTGAFPGMAPASAPTGGFPQPTGAFPGLGQAPAGPQPTGAFPGMGAAPAAGAGFPQPTGGFPGFQQPGGGVPAPAPGFPQPTGAFPGMGQAAPPPPAGGFPQPTGGFPGFQQAPQGLPPNPFGVPDDKKK